MEKERPFLGKERVVWGSKGNWQEGEVILDSGGKKVLVQSYGGELKAISRERLKRIKNRPPKVSRLAYSE